MNSHPNVLRVICLVFLVATAATTAAEAPLDPRSPDLPPGQRLQVLLERVRAEQSQMQNLEARFVQRKSSALLVEPAESVGQFSFAAPDSVRWEYLEPEPISLLIVGEEMTTWFRDLDRVERLHVGKRSQQVLKYLGVGSSLETLLSYFDVSLRTPPDADEPYRLDLEPRYARLEKRLRGMTLWIDSSSFLPVRLRYEEADGDVTEYEFSDFRLNSELPDERFVLDLPEGVEIRTVNTAPSVGN